METLKVIGYGTTYIGTNTYEPDSIEQFIKNAPEWQKRIWGTAPVNVETLNILIMHLINDNLVAGGDGSVNNDKAAHAWCIATKNDFKPIIEGAGQSDGEPTYLSSLRPETIACIAVPSILHMTSTAARIFDKTIPFYTDSLSVVQHSQVYHCHATKHIFDNDMDVILENHRLLKKLKVKLERTHVLGHQDRVKEWHELAKMEKLNVRMDKLAQDFLIKPPEHLIPPSISHLIPSTTDLH